MNKTAHTKSANVFLAVGDLLRTMRSLRGVGLGKVEHALTNPVAMGRRSAVENIGKAVAAPVLAPALGVMGVASKVDHAAKAHDPLRLLQMRSREAAVKGMSNRPVDRRQFVTDMMRGLLNPDVRQAVGTLGTAAVRGAATLAEKIASMEKQSAAEHDGLSVSEGVVNPLRIGADSFVGYKALKGAARTLLNPSEMYHGTSTEHLPGIIRDGLKPHNNVDKWVALKAEEIGRLQDASKRNGVPENLIQRDVAEELTRLEKIKQNLSTPKTFLSKGFFGGKTEAKSYAESAAHATPGSQGVVLSTTLTPDELRRAVPDVITSRPGAWNKPDIHNFSVDWTIPSRRVYKGTPSLWALIRGRSPEILKNLKANGAFRAAFGLGALGVAGLAGLDAVRTGKRTADKLTQEKSAASLDSEIAALPGFDARYDTVDKWADDIADSVRTKSAAAKCPGCGNELPKGEPLPDVEMCEVCERYGPPRTKSANRLTDLLRAGKLGKDSLQRLGMPELALPSVVQTSHNLRAAVHQNLSPVMQDAFSPQAPGLWRLYNGARKYEPGIGISPAQLFKLQETAGVAPLQELRFKLQGTPPHPLLRVANKSTKDLRDVQLLPPKIKLLASRKYDQSGGWASRGNFDSAHSYFEGLGPRRIHRGRVSYRVAGPRARVVVSGGAIDPGAPARPGIMGVLAHELGHQKENLEPQFSNYLRRRLSAMLSPTMGPVIGSLDEVPGELVGHLRATGLPASLGGMQAKRLPIAYMLEKDREGLTATRDFLRQQYPGMSNGLLGRVLSARAHAAANYAVPFQRPGSMLKSAAIAAITPFEKLARYRRIDHARPNPSQAQIESQNFKMGHVDFHGIDITIENEKGSIRRGTTKEGKKWESVLTCPYGYIRSAAGGKSGERVRPKAIDGDHLDVFVGPNKASELVVVIDQHLGGKYDESKFLLGCDSQDEGVRLYRSNYQRGWPEMPASTCTFAQFKEWLKDGDHKKPFAGQMVKAAAVGEFLKGDNEGLDWRWGLLGGSMVQVPAAAASLAYATRVAPWIHGAENTRAEQKIFNRLSNQAVSSGVRLGRVEQPRYSAANFFKPAAPEAFYHEPNGRPQIGLSERMMRPGALAHELGHAQGGRALFRANLIGARGMLGLGQAGLFAKDETTGRNIALAGTAFGGATLASELDAGRRGYKSLRALGSKRLPALKSFAGLPTYLMAAAMPLVGHYAKKWMGGYDKPAAPAGSAATPLPADPAGSAATPLPAAPSQTGQAASRFG